MTAQNENNCIMNGIFYDH